MNCDLWRRVMLGRLESVFHAKTHQPICWIKWKSIARALPAIGQAIFGPGRMVWAGGLGRMSRWTALCIIGCVINTIQTI